jgi:hypothetical protein
MMGIATMANPAPTHLWIIGGIAFLWNGVFLMSDFVINQIAEPGYHAFAAETLGIPASAVTAYYAAWPLWAVAAWAIAVFGATIGAILLLIRSRFAFHAFCAGLIGSPIMGAFVISFPMPRTAGDIAMEFSEQIQPVFWRIEWLIFAAIIIYAYRLSASDVLE